jgi:acetyltransferase
MLLEVPPKLARNVVIDQVEAEKILTRVAGDGLLPEAEVRALLTAYGLPIIETLMADTEEQASRLSADIGYPVVMKLCFPDISRKTDAGGVRLDLRSDSDVRRAFRDIIASAGRYKPNARIEGVTIQPYLANPDFEILLGAKRDPDFGPVILFGLGGIFTEVMIKDGRAVVVDARLLVSTTKVLSPLYLVISPYPGENEYRLVTDSGIHIFVRPVKPKDASLFVNLFKELSPMRIRKLNEYLG